MPINYPDEYAMNYLYGDYEPDPVFCPICHDECTRIIKNAVTGEILGCNMCTEEFDAYDELEDYL